MHVWSTRSWLVLAVLAAACGDNRTHPDPDRYVPPDPDPLGCVPDLDGRIDADELPVALGVPVSFLVSPAGAERPVDLIGRVSPDGRRVWGWSGAVPEDQLADQAAAPLEGRWYADAFPGGEMVLPIDAGARVEGVYIEDDRALWLLGVASSEADPPEGRTIMVYDAPVALYRFPVEPGSAHVATGQVRDGTFRGLPYAGRDVYEVSVDAVGVIELPDLTFEQAHRVRTRVTVEPAVGASTSRRQVSWLFECFGEVARATSRPDETEQDFTIAAEVRRLAL